ncbi:uncharacterized protein PRCAT00003903001 [Priceomyces carsonii]|uniref:uncharacterized protein n=1 Tax=Priceomyces carsonii TaxID=28549 RepID=UPI002ED8CE3F|nr:unnamed protein product [Priceomyces carsonii]
MSSNTLLADSEAPIVLLSAKRHFEQLPTQDAKLYAHYLSRASHWGTRVVLRSVSKESEDIYDLILNIHAALGEPTCQEEYVQALSGRFDNEEAIRQYLEYASQFLSNLGNFKSFGDKKFIPRLSSDEFEQFVRAVPSGKVIQLYKRIEGPLYDTTVQLLGWPESGHVSSYYIGDNIITKEEVDEVNSALANKGIMPENTRVEKVSGTKFVVHVASSRTDNKTGYYPDEPIKFLNGKELKFKFGDHHKEFKEIVENLKKAKEYAANDTERNLVRYYIEAFETGSMNAHKKSQIEWVKDMGPQVESNIGFIETYRDPSGVRGEWEGLVAMVNQDRTAKFSTLVKNATELISYLPWDKVYEKDTFTPPDFTSLEVLTFAGSGIPAGINIPNYDDVRLNYGFKNVSLGNVLSANPKKPRKEEVITFISKSLQDPFRKWRDDAFEVQVGLHELLGHGSGKLLQETSPGHFNFDKDILDSKTYYKPTDTWSSLFGTTSGSFEECRAELVALYLILKYPLKVLPIFGIIATDSQEQIMKIGTVLMCRAGLLSLEFWDPSSRKWGQPHMQARFSILKCLISAGVCSFSYRDEKDYEDLEIAFDFSKLQTAAVDALGDYLNKLHVYKSTANVKEGVAFYNDATNVTDEYSRFREVVLKKKLPRKQLIQANTHLSGGNAVEIHEYDESEVGMIESYFNRGV